MNPKEIAVTILNQLGGQGKLRTMIGADLFAYSEDSGVQFRFKYSKKFNQVTIKLNSMDLYDITFLRIRNYRIGNREQLENIYADQLVEIFENKTGLRLSL